MMEAMGLKLSYGGTIEKHHLPTTFHENIPSSSKDIHRYFIAEDSHVFRTFSLQ
jgi:hypothetical protein